MSFEKYLQDHTEALNNHTAALNAHIQVLGGTVGVVNPKTRADQNSDEARQAAAAAAAPKGTKGKKGAPAVESLTGTDKVADPLEHPAFKALVADIYKLVDIDTANNTSSMADICAQFGVVKVSQLPSTSWAECHALIKQAIADGSAPKAAAGGSFV